MSTGHPLTPTAYGCICERTYDVLTQSANELEKLKVSKPRPPVHMGVWICGPIYLCNCSRCVPGKAGKNQYQAKKQFDAFRDWIEKSNEGLSSEVQRQGHLLERVGQILGATPTSAQVKTAAVQLLAEAKVMLNLSATIAARTKFGAEAVVRDKTGKLVSRSNTVKP